MGVWQQGPPPCRACGSSGYKVRISDNMVVCRAHEYVCSAHLKDPCPECDSE